MRKHFIYFDSSNEAQFYSWECITLDLGKRSVNLVIKDEKIMSSFIKLLIYKLRTVDGNRNSAIKLDAKLTK